MSQLAMELWYGDRRCNAKLLSVSVYLIRIAVFKHIMNVGSPTTEVDKICLDCLISLLNCFSTAI